MFGSQAKQTPQEITFLLIPGFSMIGFAAMVDPLRWANTISEQPLYTWQIVSIHGGAVESSDGISLLADCPIEQLIYHQVREGHQHQRMSLRARYGVSNPKLLETLAIMQREVENPTPIPKLAEQAHISERELERLFRKYFSSTPIAFYRSLRLEKARQFLQQTSYSITQVAVLCGFASVSHFSRCYRRQYGYPPREERKREPLLGRI